MLQRIISGGTGGTRIRRKRRFRFRISIVKTHSNQAEGADLFGGQGGFVFSG
jgi:hypothetical protein